MDATKKFRFGYHYTDADPGEIVSVGFIPDRTKGYTLNVAPEVAELQDASSPMARCFVSNPGFPPQYATSKNRLRIDLSGLNLYPDFANLIELGAYYDEDFESGGLYFWWKDRDIESLRIRGFGDLADYLGSTDGCVFPEEFGGEESWNLIGTACVDARSVTPDRISVA